MTEPAGGRVGSYCTGWQYAPVLTLVLRDVEQFVSFHSSATTLLPEQYAWETHG